MQETSSQPKLVENSKTLFSSTLSHQINSKFDDQEDADVDTYTSMVPTTDDPTLPVITFRVIFIGTLWSVLLSFINTMLSFRTNPFVVEPSISILLSYPLGLFLAKVLPSGILNPGSFNVKEHVLISVISTAASSTPYGLDNVVVQKFKLFLGNDNVGFWSSLAWILVTQFMGFGIAGLTRRFLIKPKSMIFPASLSQVSLFVSLHKPDSPLGHWTMSRYKFFWLSFGAIFLYTWIPEYVAPSLQIVSIMCLFGGGNRMMRFLGSGGYGKGIGMFSLTFDWYYIRESVITTPFRYTMNVICGNVMYMYIILPILFYYNVFRDDKSIRNHSGTSMPAFAEDAILNSPSLFSRNGSRINALSLYKPVSFELDEVAYAQIGPIYITEMFALSYFATFVTLASMFSHVALWHGSQIIRQARCALAQVKDDKDSDIHNRLMSVYPDIPDWGFMLFLLGSMAAFLVVTQTTPFMMQISIIPIGIIKAVTGVSIPLNVLAQVLIGYIDPGKVIQTMTFKSLVTNNGLQALSLIRAFKLAHYMKVPPLAMLLAQFYGTLIGSFTSCATGWMMMTVPVFSEQISTVSPHWNPIMYTTFYNSGAIWGAIGTDRFFGQGSPYQSLAYGFAIGFILPFIPYALNRLRPHRFWTLINIPMLSYLSSTGELKNGIIVPFLVAILFQFIIFRYHKDWFIKYNYVFAAAVSSSVAMCVVCINLVVMKFGTLENPSGMPRWYLNQAKELDFYCYD